jgi:hypothetical protein
MMLPPKEGFMFRTILGALPLVLIAGATTAEAHGLHASLSDLVRQSDRIVVAKVEGIQSAFEEHTVAVRDGQPITGKFVFTYVEIRPTEHIVGAPTETITVRLLGGVHPGGSAITTYLDAPSLSSAEAVLLFLEQVPERGPDNQTVHQIAFHRAGKFRVEGEGTDASVVRSLPNAELKIDPREEIGAGPIDLSRMRTLIQSERAARGRD